MWYKYYVYIHTIHTYIHTYNTYIHTYIHTYIYPSRIEVLHIDGNIIRQLPPEIGSCHALVELVGSNNQIEEVTIKNMT